MSESPDDHDFNWVKARHECSVKFEFECLRKDIEKCRDARMHQLGKERRTQIIVRSNADSICVESRNNQDGIPPAVIFDLHCDHILVRSQLPNPVEELKLMLTLDNDGKCQFQINGEGAYKRWQVLRRTLEGLLFRPRTD
jgi:hypothetical protein